MKSFVNDLYGYNYTKKQEENNKEESVDDKESITQERRTQQIKITKMLLK